MSKQNAVPNCPRCGLPLKQYEVWDSKRPEERCAWMCIPCKNAGYCIEGVARTYTEAARNVRNQNIPEKLWKYIRLVRELYPEKIKDLVDRGFSKCQVCGLPVGPMQQYYNHETHLIGHAMCVHNYPEWRGWI